MAKNSVGGKMQKYCKIIDSKTGLVQLGVGCSDEYYVSIGMKLRDVEESEIDNNWYLANKCPHYTEQEKFEIAKADKYSENDTKASEARYGKEFTITIQEQECVFDTKPTTQADLLTAFAVCSTGSTYDGWVTNNGVELDLTLEDVALISATFKSESDVYHQWNEYKQAIDNAKSIKEIERIIINYD